MALQKRGVRCVTGDSTDLLHTEEIAAVRAILEVINNPLQDIPLIAVLTSPIFGFTADDLAKLRGENRYCDFYSLLCNSDSNKCKAFLGTLNQLRISSRLSTVTELISEIFEKTNILSTYGCMPDGEIKKNNLQTFFQFASDYEATGPKDLSRFLELLDASEEKGLSGNCAQQEKGAVTIMSIHKSKGLEFPIVFMCGLSRSFNQESAHAQVLCHKDLGLGLECTDTKLRVRYPTIAKRAISIKIARDSLSEEMRVLYVALTRAKDRLIMTYASKNLSRKLDKIALRLDMCSNEMLSSEADCPGWWVLQSALTRTEAGQFFNVSFCPDCSRVRDTQWLIEISHSGNNYCGQVTEEFVEKEVSDETLRKISALRNFSYSNHGATQIPSKVTATQLKGRTLDQEVAEGTYSRQPVFFRKAGTMRMNSGISYGNIVHSVMQHIRFSECDSVSSISRELSRLTKEQYITSEQERAVDCESLFAFFDSPLGKKIRSANNVLREYKFSVLDDAQNYYPAGNDEQILLQGVVDLALIEEDGIIVLDFKTDYVTEKSLSLVAEGYKAQVSAYANALTRIYQIPIKAAYLYFFTLNKLVEVI